MQRPEHDIFTRRFVYVFNLPSTTLDASINNVEQLCKEGLDTGCFSGMALVVIRCTLLALGGKAGARPVKIAHTKVNLTVST